MSEIRSGGRNGLRPVQPLGWWPVLFVVALAGSAYCWMRPVDHDVSVPKSFTATYGFDYTADVSDADEVYSNDTLAFGDPVFLNVVDVVEVEVDYGLDGSDAALTGGLLTTKVVVASDSGWSRVLLERTDVAFEGNTTSAAVRVDFGTASRTADSIATSSGIEGRVTVSVLASVEGAVTLPGRVEGGNERVSVTAASLVFDLDANAARVHGYQAPSAESLLGETQTSAASATSVATGTPATQSIADMVNVVHNEATTLSLFKWDVEVDQLRRAGVVLSALFLLFMLYNALLLWLAARRSEVDFLELRHGTRIFPLLDAPATVRAEAVWVGSFETLVAMAANAEVDILHRRGSINDSYYVFDGPRVFGYAAKRSRVSRPGVAAELGDPIPEGSEA